MRNLTSSGVRLGLANPYDVYHLHVPGYHHQEQASTVPRPRWSPLRRRGNPVRVASVRTGQTSAVGLTAGGSAALALRRSEAGFRCGTPTPYQPEGHLKRRPQPPQAGCHVPVPSVCRVQQRPWSARATPPQEEPRTGPGPLPARRVGTCGSLLELASSEQ